MSSSASPTPLHQDEISLGELCLRTLRFYQRYVRLLTIPALVLALGVAWQVALRPLYALDAILEVPEITLSEWRQVQPYLWDQTWTARSFTGDSPQITKLQALAQKSSFWTANVSYLSSLIRDDVREIPGLQNEKIMGLGLALKLQVRDEEQAERYLQLLTQHIRQAFLANSLLKTVRDNQKVLAEAPKLKVEQLQAAFEIQQAQQRISDMREVLERYPETRQMAPNTVVSVSDDGGKYLAPLPQIVALEATVSEQQAHLRKLQRDQHKLEATALLLAGLDEAVQQAASGTDMLTRIKANRDRLRAAQPALSAEQEEALQELNTELDLAQARYEAIGSKSRSALSLEPIPARNPLVVAVMVFLFVFGALSAWLAIHVWLRGANPVLGWLPSRIRPYLINEIPS